MRYRAIIQLVSGEEAVIKSTASQINNLIKALEGDVEVELVCHGESLSFVLADGNKWADIIEYLLGKSIEIVACENMLDAHAKSPRDLFTGIKTVPSAIAEIVVKQQEGWSYVKAGF